MIDNHRGYAWFDERWHDSPTCNSQTDSRLTIILMCISSTQIAKHRHMLGSVGCYNTSQLLKRDHWKGVSLQLDQYDGLSQIPVQSGHRCSP